MALSFRSLSIRKKLTTLMMAISLLILVLASSLYVAEEIYSSRSFLDREMFTLGSTLGDSCKKLLMLRKIETTKEILASLQLQPNIRAAYLFDEDGTPVAQYLDSSAMPFILKIIPLDFSDSQGRFWTDLSERKIISSWQHLGLFLPIEHENRQVGSVYLMSDLRDLYGRLSGVVFMVLSLLGGFLFFSWWLAGKLQSTVSAPLLSLVDTMGSVSQSKDYTLRAQKQGGDEVGLLVDGFNQMLEKIEVNRQELVDHQQSLEMTVEKRTEELQQMVTSLEYAKQQAEAASEAKSQFLANITHELRTPMIGVLGMNELMFRTSMDDQQQILATTVKNSGAALLTLINNVLDFSKIEAGKLHLEEAEFALYQVVDEVLTLLSSPAAEKGLALYSQIPLAATCRVLGDKLRIRQILLNLIGNAIKFTEQGSVTLNLNCSSPNADDVIFSIEIIDTGIGMDEETKQQIFSAFYQADESHTRKYGGTGLGLAIVLQLVQLLDGTLEMESSAGKGSCFRIGFSLPLAADRGIELPETLQGQPALVYTPDAVSQKVLASRLEELGMRVVTADSAADAWSQIGSAERSGQAFQLAFISTDAILPEGQSLYLAIRDEPHLGFLRRILLLKHSQSIEVGKQERKLYLPIGWDNLYETLCQSWQELQQVEKASVESKVVVETEKKADRLRLLLAGGKVAGRELIRISLADLPIEVETAENFSQLQKMSQVNRYNAILLDAATLPMEQLPDFCRQQQKSSLFVICSPADDIATLLPLISGIIKTPYKRALLLPLLQPLLEETADLTLQPSAEDKGRV